MRILLVEDHAQTRSALRRLLAQWGHVVTPVGTLADARRACRDERFELMLCDLGLPDGNGCDLAEVARDCGVRAVAVSGHDPHALAGRADGFWAYLMKPISLDQLSAVLIACEAELPQVP